MRLFGRKYNMFFSLTNRLCLYCIRCNFLSKIHSAVLYATCSYIALGINTLLLAIKRGISTLNIAMCVCVCVYDGKRRESFGARSRRDNVCHEHVRADIHLFYRGKNNSGVLQPTYYYNKVYNECVEYDKCIKFIYIYIKTTTRLKIYLNYKLLLLAV